VSTWFQNDDTNEVPVQLKTSKWTLCALLQWPEMSRASSLAFQHNEIQKSDNLPQILYHQERDAGLSPSPSQQGKDPAWENS